MARINAPVLGFYGKNDARVPATVEPTKRAMTRLGKQYEVFVYRIRSCCFRTSTEQQRRR